VTQASVDCQHGQRERLVDTVSKLPAPRARRMRNPPQKPVPQVASPVEDANLEPRSSTGAYATRRVFPASSSEYKSECPVGHANPCDCVSHVTAFADEKRERDTSREDPDIAP
jgi:hypothetical protein